ncbi:MAG: hypothetical protein Q4G42_08045 [Neisseria sp.]|nr:hypothetical protein [Neisseria sp.]
MKNLGFILLLLTLCACALTPEQQAARAAAEARQQRALEIHLTAQCDTRAADLMQQADSAQAVGDTAALEKIMSDYRRQIDHPQFRNCHRLAWENYYHQRRIDALERREAMRDMNEWMMWHRPVFCRNVVIDGRIYRDCR